ncbi:Protein of unknown function (DUF2927) [Leptolyngbya sp. PCC 7375]|nr:Protein of unknown function (DUF2927) [Leptolyngbya sp. PCC 7375]
MIRFLVGTALMLVSLSGCLQPHGENSSISTADASDAEITNMSVEQTNEILDYFYEVALSSEFGESTGKVIKWETDIKIFISGQYPTYLDVELTKIIDELNQLSESIQLTRTASKEESNYLIHFGSAAEYSDIEPNAKPYVDDNWGLLWVYWDGNGEIYQGSMYVDVLRATDEDAQKHILREELTQSLGLLNDSYKYPESIFYQKWTETTEYSAIDQQIIKILYSDKVKANMTQQELNAVFKSL